MWRSSVLASGKMLRISAALASRIATNLSVLIPCRDFGLCFPVLFSLKRDDCSAGMIDREAIYSALWDIASNSANYVTKERRLRHRSDVTPAEQPALFMAEIGNTAETKQSGFNLPVVWTLHAEFYIYVHSSDQHAPPATVLNPLIDVLERALAPDPINGIQDLGLPETLGQARGQDRHC